MPHAAATKPTRPLPGRGAAGRQRAPVARILIVEDEPVTAEVFARALRADGHEVRVARDGVQALRALREDPPDVVVLDLGLPTMPGLEVLRRLRDGADRPTPVVVVSGAPPQTLPAAGTLLPPGRWLLKPLRPRELVAAVRELRAT
jgi:DNA-binding response OmpR family regulator